MKTLLAAALILAAYSVPALAEKGDGTSHAGRHAPVRKAAVAKVNPTAALASAKKRVLWTLKDPESAHWRRAKVAANGDVCLEVNAKNSFGAYTGFEPMYVEYKTGYIASNNGDLMVWGHCVSMRGTVRVNAAAQ